MASRRRPFGLKHKRRILDKIKSLRAYEIRLHTLSDNVMQQLSGKWLASFDMYDSYTVDDEEINTRYETFLDNSCFRLARVCKSRDIQIKGVTSSKVVHGTRIAALCADELEDILYVGPHNSFHKYKASVFSLLPQDKRYIVEQNNILQE